MAVLGAAWTAIAVVVSEGRHRDCPVPQFYFTGSLVAVLILMCLTGAEMLGINLGIGYFIEKYKSFADYRCVLAGIVTVGVITTVIDILVNKAEKTLIRWEE